MDENKYHRVIKEACIHGIEVLKNGGRAIDACEAAIIHLEDCANTNAGYGSNLTWDGHVQCDASIMNGNTLHFGACTNVQTVKNPIQLARIICDRQDKMLSMERLPPMAMAGQGAESYAEEVGCSMIEANGLISSRAKVSYNHYKSKAGNMKASSLNNFERIISNNILDTVGAVCVDGSGNSAAGCSSGGLLMKVPGRIGQAATYGAGCWATDTDDISVATCTTGNGEYLMRTFLAKEICTDLFTAECPVTSLYNTLKNKFLQSPFLSPTMELYAGALSLIYHPKAKTGEILWSHTTKSLCIGYMSSQQKTPKVCI